jgi:hypothetical protein
MELFAPLSAACVRVRGWSVGGGGGWRMIILKAALRMARVHVGPGIAMLIIDVEMANFGRGGVIASV